MRFQPGQSGNPAGARKGPRARQARIRKLIADSSFEIVEAIIKNAKAGDIAAQQLFCRFMLPRQRFIPMPVEMPLIDSIEVARSEIARLACLAGAGEIDLDSMTQISRTVCLAAGLRTEELEDLLELREQEAGNRVRHDN